MRQVRLGLVLAWAAAWLALGAATSAQRGSREAVVGGLDHVPVAVSDLDAAAATYRALGFTLKPGAPHANGIRNFHSKFPDGTEIELITAPKAVDELTTTYRRHLEFGDGPAFLALFAPDRPALEARLAEVGRSFRRNGGLVSLRAEDPFGFVFFGRRNASPTDRPEHFVHANTATTLAGVWLALDMTPDARALVAALGGTLGEEEVEAPERTRVWVARLGSGRLLFLGAHRQLVRGRPIVGLTVRVKDIRATRRLVPPPEAQGLWIRFDGGP